LNDVAIYGSLGYDDVKRNDFDLIVSNIPDHAGETVIACLLREARYYLKPGGTVAVVVVAPLQAMVAGILASTPGAGIVLERHRPGHTVFHYKFPDVKTPGKPAPSALERGIYHRDNITLRSGKLEYALQTAVSLPEFDSLGYGSEMLLEALEKQRERETHHAVVFNPGQGHTAVAAWKYLQPGAITLVDRDLLALRYSQLNLVLNGCPLERIGIQHQTGLQPFPQEKTDLIIGILRGEEGEKATFSLLDRAVGRLNERGTIILASGSTAITRLADYAARQGLLRIKTRERRRGHSLLVMERV
jgi:ribosomal protein L11 methylase PrmA